MSRKYLSRKSNSRGKMKVSNQQFPIAGGSNQNESPIQGGASNRNFPSGSTGNNPQRFRQFSPSQISQYCSYEPCKDFNRCLSQSINAVPSRWTRAQTADIQINSANSAPVITDPLRRISPDLWIWDMWPLMEKDGSVAVLPGGWRVLFALSAPRSVLPNNRHDVARIAYFYSRDGLNWIQGGPVFEEGTAFGSRQWAGSAIIDNGRIYYFYTASGRRGESEITYEQRIAMSSSGFISDLDGVELVNFAPHEVILEPDGVLYQTLAQSQVGDSPIIYAFRDPYFFKDPATGCEYLLFEGNIAGTYLDVNCGSDVPEDARYYTGNIGIALLNSTDYSSWQLLPALLEAGCTNQQTERPHIIVSNGLYYLFTDSHRFTFAPGLPNGPGPDGLYGFVAGSLRGNYQPLNYGGLVVSNPIEEPNQAYSWLVLPDFSVLSFVDTYNLQGITTDELATLPESFQVEHFGGTLAPTLQLRVSGTTTEIVWEYDFGLVMVAESEAPKCNRNGAEDSNGCSCFRNNNRCRCGDDGNVVYNGGNGNHCGCGCQNARQNVVNNNQCSCGSKNAGRNVVNSNHCGCGCQNARQNVVNGNHCGCGCQNARQNVVNSNHCSCGCQNAGQNVVNDNYCNCEDENHYDDAEYNCDCYNDHDDCHIEFPKLDPNRFNPDKCQCRNC